MASLVCLNFTRRAECHTSRPCYLLLFQNQVIGVLASYASQVVSKYELYSNCKSHGQDVHMQQIGQRVWNVLGAGAEYNKHPPRLHSELLARALKLLLYFSRPSILWAEWWRGRREGSLGEQRVSDQLSVCRLFFSECLNEFGGLIKLI